MDMIELHADGDGKACVRRTEPAFELRDLARCQILEGLGRGPDDNRLKGYRSAWLGGCLSRDTA
jgi:hypothetical protein